MLDKGLTINAGINLIHNRHHPSLPPTTRREGSKNPSPGTIIVYKNPPLGTEKGVRNPTPQDIKLENFTNISMNSDTIWT